MGLRTTFKNWFGTATKEDIAKKPIDKLTQEKDTSINTIKGDVFGRGDNQASNVGFNKAKTSIDAIDLDTKSKVNKQSEIIQSSADKQSAMVNERDKEYRQAKADEKSIRNELFSEQSKKNKSFIKDLESNLDNTRKTIGRSGNIASAIAGQAGQVSNSDLASVITDVNNSAGFKLDKATSDAISAIKGINDENYAHALNNVLQQSYLDKGINEIDKNEYDILIKATEDIAKGNTKQIDTVKDIILEMEKAQMNEELTVGLIDNKIKTVNETFQSQTPKGKVAQLRYMNHQMPGIDLMGDGLIKLVNDYPGLSYEELKSKLAKMSSKALQAQTLANNISNKLPENRTAQETELLEKYTDRGWQAITVGDPSLDETYKQKEIQLGHEKNEAIKTASDKYNQTDPELNSSKEIEDTNRESIARREQESINDANDEATYLGFTNRGSFKKYESARNDYDKLVQGIEKNKEKYPDVYAKNKTRINKAIASKKAIVDDIALNSYIGIDLKPEGDTIKEKLAHLKTIDLKEYNDFVDDLKEVSKMKTTNPKEYSNRIKEIKKIIN